MSIDELEAAITGPAGKVGVDVEPLVVSEMVGEIVDRPGALPLLQYTLTELFEARVGRTITIAAYRAGGGVSRTLARRADSLLAGLGPETTETARHVLLRLVSLDDDGSGAETRRRALVAEVEELDERGRVAAGARHVRAAPPAELRSRPRHARPDRRDLPRGAADGVDHAARLDRRRPRRPAHPPPPRRRDERVDGRRPLTRLPPARRAARHRSRRGPRRPRWGCDRRSTSSSMPAWRRAPRSNGSARRKQQRTTDAERRARRRTRQLVDRRAGDGARRRAGDVRLGAAPGRPRGRGGPHRQPGRRNVSPRLSVNTLPTDPELALLLAKEAVSATADRGYAVPEAIDATHWALQELGVQYDVTPDTPDRGTVRTRRACAASGSSRSRS